MAGRFNIYSQLVISAIRIADITIYARAFVSCSLRGFPTATIEIVIIIISATVSLELLISAFN